MKKYEVLTSAEVLPFQVFGEEDVGEDLRLKYRYLDLRRERMHNKILFRNRVIKSMRDKMWDMGFSEFQTPNFGRNQSRRRTRFYRSIADESWDGLCAASITAAMETADPDFWI